MGKTYFVYFMSNKSRRLYVGITSELPLRVWQHKHKWYEGSFTARYRFDMLVYFEAFSHPQRGYYAGERNQGLAAGEKAAVDPGGESRLGRFERGVGGR